MGKKVFLDCGGHCGESILKFLSEYPDYEFYTFEPNRELAQHVIANICATGKTVFFYPGAVWSHDGFVNFFIGHDQGSTALKGKVEYAQNVQQVDYNSGKEVPCIDISQWIMRNIGDEDQLIVKMDIEGGEYEVLPKMIRDGAIEKVMRLYCEWHQDRFPNIDKREHESLVVEVASLTDLRTWL